MAVTTSAVEKFSLLPISKTKIQQKAMLLQQKAMLLKTENGVIMVSTNCSVKTGGTCVSKIFDIKFNLTVCLQSKRVNMRGKRKSIWKWLKKCTSFVKLSKRNE